MISCLDYLNLRGENDYGLNNQRMTAEYKKEHYYNTRTSKKQGGKNATSYKTRKEWQYRVQKNS